LKLYFFIINLKLIFQVQVQSNAKQLPRRKDEGIPQSKIDVQKGILRSLNSQTKSDKINQPNNSQSVQLGRPNSPEIGLQQNFQRKPEMQPKVVPQAERIR